MVVLIGSLILAVTVLVQSSAVTDEPGDPIQSERELRRDVFRNYDIYTRPVRRSSTPVTVKVNLTPIRVKSLDVKSQQISLEGWMKMEWTDEYLRWDPSEYDNITVLHVSPSSVWKPDIALYTASPDTSLFPTVYTQAMVWNSGLVMWVPPYTINSRCPVPFRNYADPTRTFVECNIRMGSWTYSGKMVDLRLSTDKVDLTNFQDINHEWKLVKMVSRRESRLYPCCPEEYPFVDFNVTLKKRNFYLNSGHEN